jgi:hypothetical protein
MRELKIYSLITVVALFCFAGCGSSDDEPIILAGTKWKSDTVMMYFDISSYHYVLDFDADEADGSGLWYHLHNDGVKGAVKPLYQSNVSGHKINIRRTGGATLSGSINGNSMTLTDDRNSQYGDHLFNGTLTFRRQ